MDEIPHVRNEFDSTSFCILVEHKLDAEADGVSEGEGGVIDAEGVVVGVLLGSMHTILTGVFLIMLYPSPSWY
jgi:hypothetical protein